MKKIFLSVMLMAALHVSFAQQTQPSRPIDPVTNQKQNINEMTWDNTPMTVVNSTDLPAAINTSFKSKYPNQSNVMWYKYDKGYSASYMNENKMNTRVVYDANGTPLYTGTQINSSTLPPTVNTYLQKTYPGMNANDVYQVTTPAGDKSYQVYVNGRWMKFDSNGNLVPVK